MSSDDMYSHWIEIGMLLGMPHEFYHQAVKELGFELGPANSYGAGIVFTPKNDTSVEAIKQIFEEQVRLRGHKVLGWRKIKTGKVLDALQLNVINANIINEWTMLIDSSHIGESAKATEPRIEQIFIENTGNLSFKDFDRDLFCIRKQVESESSTHPDINGNLYICSLSSQTVTYKGQLTPEQVMSYFDDLQQPHFASHMALVHSRFSTNTFPSWERAQPIRMMCHNGEINTLRGNKNWMYSREGLMASPLFGHDHLPSLIQATSNNMSDSGNFDAVLELLAKGSQRSLPECIMMMIPEAWQDNAQLSES